MPAMLVMDMAGMVVIVGVSVSVPVIIMRMIVMSIKM
jgi:hypothetical protein